MEPLELAISRAKWCPKTNGHFQPEPDKSRIDALERRIAALETQLSTVINSRPQKSIDAEKPEINARPSISRIKQIVCEFYKITPIEMISQHRVRRIVEPRMIAVYLCAQSTLWSFPMLGKHFGARDHTTILAARNKIAQRRLVESKLNKELTELEAKL